MTQRCSTSHQQTSEAINTDGAPNAEFLHHVQWQ